MFLTHPFWSRLILVLLVLLWIPNIYIFINLGWLRFILCLLYLGGLLILFIYFSSTLPQKIIKFRVFNFCFFILGILFIYNQNFWDFISLKSEPIILEIIGYQINTLFIFFILIYLLVFLVYISEILKFNRFPIRLI